MTWAVIVSVVAILASVGPEPALIALPGHY